jgi:hypothetical protein
MKKAKYECTQYYEAVECDCGGLFINQCGMGILMTSPPQKTYSCSGCSNIATLQECDWPQVKVKIGNKIADA